MSRSVACYFGSGPLPPLCSNGFGFDGFTGLMGTTGFDGFFICDSDAKTARRRHGYLDGIADVGRWIRSLIGIRRYLVFKNLNDGNQRGAYWNGSGCRQGCGERHAGASHRLFFVEFRRHVSCCTDANCIAKIDGSSHVKFLISAQNIRLGYAALQFRAILSFQRRLVFNFFMDAICYSLGSSSRSQSDLSFWYAARITNKLLIGMSVSV